MWVVNPAPFLLFLPYSFPPEFRCYLTCKQRCVRHIRYPLRTWTYPWTKNRRLIVSYVLLSVSNSILSAIFPNRQELSGVKDTLSGLGKHHLNVTYAQLLDKVFGLSGSSDRGILLCCPLIGKNIRQALGTWRVGDHFNGQNGFLGSPHTFGVFLDDWIPHARRAPYVQCTTIHIEQACCGCYCCLMALNNSGRKISRSQSKRNKEKRKYFKCGNIHDVGHTA